MNTKTSRLFLCIFLMFGCRLYARPDSTLFPLSKSLEPNVRFWISIFTQYSSAQYLVFDAGNVDRIYEILDSKKLFPGGEPTPKIKESILKAEHEKMVRRLKRLGERDIQNQTLSKEDLKLISLFGDSVKPEEVRKAAERVRLQHGILEQFRDGLVKSGRYLDSLKSIFSRSGLPEELIYLPHVESSFNPYAGSKAGAIGMWQFVGSTGKKFLRIDDKIDERRDPYLSSLAAARLLKLGYDTLHSWPLAITAYNHGLLGVRKIVKELNTKDLGEMVTRYESKPFGFASKNFYAEFLAAVQVAQHSSDYFNGIVMDSCWSFKTIELPLEMQAGPIRRALQVNDSILQALNPSLNPSVLEGKNNIPLGFLLRIPVDADERAVFEMWVSEGLLPRGAYLAWCHGMEKTIFRYVDEIPFFISTRKDRRG